MVVSTDTVGDFVVSAGPMVVCPGPMVISAGFEVTSSLVVVSVTFTVVDSVINQKFRNVFHSDDEDHKVTTSTIKIALLFTKNRNLSRILSTCPISWTLARVAWF